LDRHGYLVDIEDIELHLDGAATNIRDRVLNDLTEFDGLNTSIEHFSRILAERLNRAIAARDINALTVRIWENEIAWAACSLDR
jgi:6-pyruvoyltetrahydropterin/6-carboxytetrahydropterin synthase